MSMDRLRTEVSGLLISWATPAASRPIDTCFSTWDSRSAVISLSRMSRSFMFLTMRLKAFASLPNSSTDPIRTL